MPGTYTIGDVGDGRIYVRTSHYNPAMVALAHSLKGRYREVTFEDETSARVWTFLRMHRERLEHELDQLYPSDEQKVTKLITFDTGDTYVVGAPVVDGLEVIIHARDTVGRVGHPAVLAVLENTLEPGGTRNGSRRRPQLRGRLKVLALVRPDAVVEWPGAEIVEEEASDAFAPADEQ